MTDLSIHYTYLYKILQDIAEDHSIAPHLIFKGGTALMLFYDLPRFSVDLDFTLIDKETENLVYDRLVEIAQMYGKIEDCNLGFYGPKVVLDYGPGTWKLKMEVSNRYWGEEPDLLTLDGFSLNVMKPSDMYAHKLIALSEREGVANRDIFDIFFFEEHNVIPNEEIISKRKGISLSEQITTDISILEKYPQNRILSSLAPLLSPEKAKWVKANLLRETINYLNRRIQIERLKERFQEDIPDAVTKRTKSAKRKLL